MRVDRAGLKHRVVLSGFFGRGNCGDEALLQAQYEFLEPRFTVVISVDERGASDGFWDRYPYDRCQIVHQANLGIMAEDDVIGIHVGGGGLPYGFNAAQVVHARSHGKPAFLTGVDAATVGSPVAADAIRSYMRLFDFVSVRSEAAFRTMCSLSPGCHHGADWAVCGTVDELRHAPRSNGVLVTIREFPQELVTGRYRAAVSELLAVLADSHDTVTLLPFCPEDERFLALVPATARFQREALWWNPRAMQQRIAAASRIVSLGRLHPLVFAANVGTPALFAEPLPGDCRWPPSTKTRQLCAENGWPCFPSIDLLMQELRRGTSHWQQPGFAAGCLGRQASMKETLLRHFEAAADSQASGSAAAARVA